MTANVAATTNCRAQVVTLLCFTSVLTCLLWDLSINIKTKISFLLCRRDALFRNLITCEGHECHGIFKHQGSWSEGKFPPLCRRTARYNSPFVWLFSRIIWWFSERKPACLLMLFVWMDKPGKSLSLGAGNSPAQVRERHGKLHQGHSAGSVFCYVVITSLVREVERTVRDHRRRREMLQWIKVFLLVANSTRLRQGRLQTKVQTEIKLVWEKYLRDASKGESHTGWTAVCVREGVWHVCVVFIYQGRAFARMCVFVPCCVSVCAPSSW